jgi:hypothetical protein
VGMAVPALMGTWTAEQLDQSAQRVRALVAIARAEAMNDARRYRVVFRTDGSVRVQRQRDPLAAPHEYVDVPRGWANQEFLLREVWVAAYQPLPLGPAPIRVEDRYIEFTEYEDDPAPIDSFDDHQVIDFEPDGRSSSARWVLRDGTGRGVLMLLDGRLGRVSIEAAKRVAPGELDRPAKLVDKEPRDERPVEGGLRGFTRG